MNIPQVVAQNCEANPSGSFYIYAIPGASETVTITHLEFGRATHRAASILRPQREGSDGQVIAVLALADTVLYHALLVGLMAADLIPFPISPRNSPAGIFELLRASSCHRIIATCTTLGPLIAGIKNHIADVDPNFALTIAEIPLLSQIYPNLGAETTDCAFQPYAISTEILLSPDDTALYMHSSGSTGFPKAIAQSHRMIMEWASLPAVAETREYTEKPVANMALPAFHLFGITCQLLQPLFGTPVAVYPPTAISPEALPMIPTPDNILEHAQKTKCRALTSVPALLAIWFNSPEAVAYLATLHTIIWSGGPLPQRIGNGLANAGVKLISGYGATETGAISVVNHYDEDAKEWAWFRVSDLVKVRWLPQGDETFECHVLSSETYSPSVQNLPDAKGFATSDLCVNHPQKKHLWRVVGRVDDAIVHTSGEKTVPAPMEDIVLSSPLVAGAVMFGNERPQTGILIETISSLQIDIHDPPQVAELRNKIWPIIEEANETAPAFSRLFKEMILFSTPDKPLPRAGKGSVLRKASIALYAPEIEYIFKTVEAQTSPVDSIQPPSAWNAGILQCWLLAVAEDLGGVNGMSSVRDLFQQGFDSLTATIFRLRIIRTLRSLGDTTFARAANLIDQNLIYARPTIVELSAYLEALVAGTDTDAGTIMSLPLVEICSGPGIPLIVLPGGNGSAAALFALRRNFHGCLWGLQITDESPLESWTGLIAFWKQQIRAKRPHGPYRLAAYSSSGVFAVALTKLLEAEGETVLQLTFIDHCPILWVQETAELLLREQTVDDFCRLVDESVLTMVRNDPTVDAPFVRDFEAALQGSPKVTPILLREVKTRRALASLLHDCLHQFYLAETPKSRGTFIQAFEAWLLSTKVPMAVIVAEHGPLHSVPGVWSDLGAERLSATAYHVMGLGHFGLFRDEKVAQILEL
ncbi:hypothetical protein K438DRAFT_1720091 [Mycena galopus ATCC 62051]|nr:hypothetical protein K438DRAFT_1720091 [Mycena galopus ATCC 62051]